MSSRWPNKTVVGLTGNIATGKSAVMRIAAEKGALTLDADQIVHYLMDHDTSIQASIAVAFGSEIRRKDGSVDRAALAPIVFSDAEALSKLESLLHPAVRVEVIERINKSDAQIVFVEAIKLLEGELKNECDAIWVADCLPVRQIERLMICRGMDDESAALRVQVQSPQARKVAQANVVIDTNGSMSDTQGQVDSAWASLIGVKPAVVTAEDKAEPVITEPIKEEPVPTPVPQAQPVPQPKPEPPTEPKAETPPVVVSTPPPESDVEITVRRARPADLPAVLLLIHRATDGKVRMKRAQLLMAMSERSYFIGQVGTEIGAVLGYAVEKGIARIEEIFIYPLEDAGIRVLGSAVIKELEKSARQHNCEALLAFPTLDANPEVYLMLNDNDVLEQHVDKVPRVWQTAVEESQPENTKFHGKMLQNIRIA